MPPAERIIRICDLLGEAFQAETLAEHIGHVAAARDAGGDVFAADALRAMAGGYRVRALQAWGDIASLNADGAGA